MKQKILMAINPDKSIGSIYSLYETKDAKKLTCELHISRSPIDQGWTNPGESVIDYVDNGNGVQIHIDGVETNIDYETVNLLRFILNRTFSQKSDETYRVYTIEEEK